MDLSKFKLKKLSCRFAVGFPETLTDLEVLAETNPIDLKHLTNLTSLAIPDTICTGISNKIQKLLCNKPFPEMWDLPLTEFKTTYNKFSCAQILQFKNG